MCVQSGYNNRMIFFSFLYITFASHGRCNGDLLTLKYQEEVIQTHPIGVVLEELYIGKTE